jgi:hypothetical protein
MSPKRVWTTFAEWDKNPIISPRIRELKLLWQLNVDTVCLHLFKQCLNKEMEKVIMGLDPYDIDTMQQHNKI